VRPLFATLLLLSGCATGALPPVPGDGPPTVRDAAKENAYQRMLERVTEHEAVYDALDTRIFAQATWQSADFVKARVLRWGEFRDAPRVEVDAELEKERARLKGQTEFFLGIHANDWHFEDFEKKDSMWRVALVKDGQEVLPTSIERLGRTNVEMRSIYSYMESFWVGYRVDFPEVDLPAGEKMVLKLASPVGEARLTFTAE